jgi:DNA uptake protein ComE-like DNA-binding protein
MRIQWRYCICTLLIACAGWTQAAQLAVVAPVMQGAIPRMRPPPSGRGTAPVAARVREGELYRAVQHEAATGFTGDMLALDEMARRIAGRGSATWLLFSMEDGGFAHSGFWLSEDGRERWVDEPVVDLVVSPGSVADGSFEEIFAHELGHVLLRRLLPALPDGYSRTPHHSFSITDQQTAFDEGFAIHFQGLARRLTRNERLREQDFGFDTRPYLPLWLSNLDREQRIQGMRQNWFVHEQITPDGPGDDIRRREMSTLFDRTRLKNAAQMLASEGVVATFFYRHLVPGATGRNALLERYQPMLRALHALNANGLTLDTAPVPALAQQLAKVDAGEGKRFIATLMETSYGALASPRLAQAAEALALPGRDGDAEAFVPSLQAARKEMAEQLAAVQAAPQRLMDAAGPALWLLHPSRTADGKLPLAIDLNTAAREHLLALPGMDAHAADRALASRRAQGSFRSLADFAARSGLAPGALPALEAMAQAQAKAGTLQRR